jgi:predicted PurR-regulated permease PerM
MSHDARDPDAGRSGAADPGGRPRTDGPHSHGLLQRAGDVAWRLAVIGVVVWGIALLTSTLTPVVVPVAVALLLAGVLEPVVRRLGRDGIPDWVVPLATVLLLAVMLAGVIGVAGARLADEWPQLRDEFSSALEDVEERFSITLPDLPGATDGSSSETPSESDSGSGIDGGQAARVLTVGSEVLFGVFLTVALTFLFLKDGAAMWAWMMARVPSERRATIDAAGRNAWTTTGGYMRGLTIVALFDAVGIGVALLVLGVPLVLTLAVLQFLLSYVPTIGAFVAGGVAVAVALGSQGVVTALIVLAAAVVVQQVGNNVIEPWVMGRLIGLHPAVVLVAVTAGAVLWGIAGALLFVPLAAALTAFVSVLWQRRAAPRHEP